MTRILLESNTFLRTLQRVLKKEPQLVDHLRETLQRIVFEFVEFKGNPAILLSTIGTHDEIY